MDPEIAALRRLSENFDSALHSDFADAVIAAACGREIPIHRCILSARSPFFKSIFSGTEGGVKLELKDLAKDFEVSFHAVVTVLAFLQRESERHLLDILDKIAADDILVVLSLANICGKECDGLLIRCVENIVRSDVDIITLDKTLPGHIVTRIVDSRKELGFHGPESSSFPDKHVKRLHRALDSHDVELVRMLIKEEHTSIDDACALHYAVAYCDAKIITGILDLAIADVNHTSPRGYTVLHIAAMRKEPKIIVSLLTKGAQPAALTSDGRKALTISKRLTRAADYYKSTERGKASPKDRLCIEILEQAERRDPLLGEVSASLVKVEGDLQMKALYLEGRVALAKLLFPTEANVAMHVAQVDGTSEHLDRIRALAKTGMDTS
ncbi:hypothetical protein RHMOL_Rhmol05G0018500 [Rhododendron molle]|uniref:Uncharacterized protein n=1 Tax=Rhododendron molle TaxID=49168 RepID=A0ACC0NJP4_RHOML|nr:hypothetical protein RHMOL_Rhmol05G0018500 [Rhododendron molle]